MEHSEASLYETPIAKVLFAVGCAVTYFLAFKLNALLFESLKFSHGVNWIFLPSGLRFLFVLVLLSTGSIGIALASLALNYTNGFSDHHVLNIVTALISGFAPLLARQICVDFLKVGNTLQHLTTKSLLQISVVFALISSLLHQVWFFWNDVTENFITSSFAMAIGDWLGTTLVLATASVTVKLYNSLASRN